MIANPIAATIGRFLPARLRASETVGLLNGGASGVASMAWQWT
jgi:hypothetical protein